MALHRMPMFVWAMLVNSFMVLFAMPSVMLATGYLALDRLVGRVASPEHIPGRRFDDKPARRIAEQVGSSTLMLTTERLASGILRQADAKVTAGTRGISKTRNGK